MLGGGPKDVFGGITPGAISLEKRRGSAAEIVAGDDLKRIVDVKARNEQRLEVVIAVGALTQDTQSKVDLDIGIRDHRLRTVCSIRAAISSRRSSGTCSSTGDRNEIICNTLASFSGMPLDCM